MLCNQLNGDTVVKNILFSLSGKQGDWIIYRNVLKIIFFFCYSFLVFFLNYYFTFTYNMLNEKWDVQTCSDKKHIYFITSTRIIQTAAFKVDIFVICNCGNKPSYMLKRFPQKYQINTKSKVEWLFPILWWDVFMMGFNFSVLTL